MVRPSFYRQTSKDQKEEKQVQASPIDANLSCSKNNLFNIQPSIINIKK